jgi:hypothetical protein
MIYDPYDDNNVNYDDVVKLLFEMKKDKHAARVMRLGEELKLLQGKLEAYYESAQSKVKE